MDELSSLAFLHHRDRVHALYHESKSRPGFEDFAALALSEERAPSSFLVAWALNGEAIYMCTPNGRFRTNVRLCLSMSDFHPETWCPLWSVSAVLTGLLSFMVGSEDTFGSIVTSEAEKIKMAKRSHEFNQKHEIFKELFPDFIRDGLERGVPARTSGDSVRMEASRLPAADSGPQKPPQESGLALIWWIAVLLALCFGAWKVCRVIGASMP